MKEHPEGIVINYDKEKVDSFISSLTFTLTDDQNTCLKEILNDLSSSYKMNRLLQGEVGSGKLSYLLSLYMLFVLLVIKVQSWFRRKFCATTLRNFPKFIWALILTLPFFRAHPKRTKNYIRRFRVWKN